MTALATLFVVGMCLMPAALADDVEDIKAAVQRYYAEINSEDAYALIQLRVTGSTGFPADGGLLQRFDSLEERRKNQQAAFDAGLKYNLQARHVDVTVYGNLTALGTWYAVGAITDPNGTTRQVNNRVASVWVKQGGRWKIAHQHISPLRVPRIEDRFVGTWRFVSIEQRNAKGEPLPVISRRTGFIIYTPTGHMAVQLMEDDRKEFAAAQPSGEEARVALASYNAYSGTFTVNEAQGTVTHHRQTKLTPGTVDALGGTDVIRFYRFSANQLMLTPPPRTIDGEELTRTLTWERIE
jgi:ketosteroid isomerase-like protein